MHASRFRMSSFLLAATALAAAPVAVVACEDSSGGNLGNGDYDASLADVDSSSADGGVTNDGATNSGSDAAHDADSAALLPAIDAGADCVPVTSREVLAPGATGLPTSELALWLRADRGVYGKTIDSGVPPEVCAWQDVSGGPTVLTNSAPPSRPSLEALAVGGQTGVRFSAKTQVMTAAGVLGIGATSPRTMIAVELLTGADGRFNPIMQGQGGTAGAYIAIDANTWQTAGSLEGVYVTNNSFDVGTATTTAAARVHVLTITETMTVGNALQSAIDYRINGQTQTLTKRAGSGKFEDFSGANFTAVGVFGTPSMSGTTQGGIVAEVLVYGRALTLTERGAAETALKARYGIP